MGELADSTGSAIVRRGVVAVVARQQRLLVIRRSQHVIAAGMLCFPGGGIEGEESETAALVREMREELNADVQPVRRIWTSVTSWRVALSWWLTELPPDIRPEPNPDEVASIHWHTPAEMARLPDLLESNLDFLAALERGEITLDG